MKKARAEERIATYLSGNMNAGEQEQLMDWVDKNSDNQTFFDNAVKLWSAADDFVYPDFSKGKAQAWENVSKSIGGQQKGKVRRLSIFRLSIAASIALLVAAGFWWLNQSPPAATFATNTNERQTVDLPDGTKVWLNEDSQLAYHENDNERSVTLSGEAFFDVQTDSLRPFNIYAGNSLTTVLGTSFNVRAYPDEEAVEVTVETGRVLLQEAQVQKSKVELTKGKTGVYKAGKADMKSLDKPNENATAWKTGMLKFEDTPMPIVIEDLERYFDLEIKMENPVNLNCPFTSTFPDPSLEVVIETLEFQGWKIHKTGETIVLNGKGCN